MNLAKPNAWQWLEQQVDLTRGDGVSMLLQTARGLSHVHSKCIVHLDMKPENIVSWDAGHDGMKFQVADFGHCKRGPKDHKGNAERVAADMVNAAIYRPLHLFYAAGAEVGAHYSFDLWAFGCIVFDVLQKHPRWRSEDGRATRLFSGVRMNVDFITVLHGRDYRLVKHVEKDVLALIVRLQLVEQTV